MVAGKMNSFLRGFQTDVLMIPFMADTTGDLARNFFEKNHPKRCLKKMLEFVQSNLIQSIRQEHKKTTRKY